MSNFDDFDLEETIQDVAKPTSCPNQFPSIPPTTYRLAIIGDFPSADDCHQQKPFVGMAGQFLSNILSSLSILRDGEDWVVGDTRLTAWDTPGHARHHHAFVMDDVCFTGDVAGVRLMGCNYLSVAAAPPQFEPEPYVQSVERLLAANFSRLYLTHFGEVADVRSHLEAYRQRIREVHSHVADWVREGTPSYEVAERYTSVEHDRAMVLGVSEEDWSRYQLANGSVMCASGVELFVKKHG